MKYSINLNAEDSYDDSNYSEYETMEYDYFDDEDNYDDEDEEEDEGRDKAKEDELLTIYNQDVPVKTHENMRSYFGRLAETSREGTPEEKAEAGEQACLHLRGMIYQMIRGRYHTYVDSDPSFEEDLLQSAFANIIANLPRYDPEKGQPSTYFYNYINSALSTETNSMKHHIKAPDAALKRKIKRINKEFAKIGETATIEDYIVETGESSAKIKDVLAMMQRDMNTHLEAIEDYDQLIEGDFDKSEDFKNPETVAVENCIYEEIVSYIKETFTDEESAMFLAYAVDDMTIPEISRAFGYDDSDDKVRRVIANVTHNVKYNVNIRRLVAGRVDGISDDTYVFSVLPLEGTDYNMDLLEDAL